ATLGCERRQLLPEHVDVVADRIALAHVGGDRERRRRRRLGMRRLLHRRLRRRLDRWGRVAERRRLARQRGVLRRQRRELRRLRRRLGGQRARGVLEDALLLLRLRHLRRDGGVGAIERGDRLRERRVPRVEATDRE